MFITLYCYVIFILSPSVFGLSKRFFDVFLCAGVRGDMRDYSPDMRNFSRIVRGTAVGCALFFPEYAG